MRVLEGGASGDEDEGGPLDGEAWRAAKGRGGVPAGLRHSYLLPLSYKATVCQVLGHLCRGAMVGTCSLVPITSVLRSSSSLCSHHSHIWSSHIPNPCPHASPALPAWVVLPLPVSPITTTTGLACTQHRQPLQRAHDPCMPYACRPAHHLGWMAMWGVCMEGGGSYTPCSQGTLRRQH